MKAYVFTSALTVDAEQKVRAVVVLAARVAIAGLAKSRRVIHRAHQSFGARVFVTRLAKLLLGNTVVADLVVVLFMFAFTTAMDAIKVVHAVQIFVALHADGVQT